MQKKLSPSFFIKLLRNFSEFHKTSTYSYRYRIVSTFAEYDASKLIRLSFTDCPGDFLSPMSIEAIKRMPDVLKELHPMDVNSINDLYYLSNDQIVEIRIEKENIVALKAGGGISRYNIQEKPDFGSMIPPRISYIWGYMQAEKIMNDNYRTILDEPYKIVKDNLTTLEIVDYEKDEKFLKSPLELIFSEEYKKFSKEDICKIGYICGQMSQIDLKKKD